MTAFEIEGLCSNVLERWADRFVLNVSAPQYPGGGYLIKVEDSIVVGSISIWTNGMVDWDFWRFDTAAQHCVGHLETALVQCIAAKIDEVLTGLLNVTSENVMPPSE